METNTLPEIKRHALGFIEMDSQHEHLYDVFALLGSDETSTFNDKHSPILKEIERYFLFHFASEELLMRSYGFRGFEVHRGDHENFEERLAAFLEQYENGALNPRYLRDFLTQWLSEHGSQTDALYVAWISKAREQLRALSTQT